jgi:DAACS family dicarboxylate/amino acid:cation (Na+ or H+) symporter
LTKISLHHKIFAGLVIGAILGTIANKTSGTVKETFSWIIAHITEPLGQLFMRLLLMIVIPLIFSSLALSVLNLKSLRAFGRLGLRSLLLCLMISVISVVIGLGLANLIQPGKRLPPALASELQQRFAAESEKVTPKTPASPDTPMMSLVKTVVPSNIFASLASDPPNLIQIMFFAVVFGVGLMLLPEEKSAIVAQFLEAIASLSGRIVDGIMRLAPLAVTALVFNNLARYGVDLLMALGWFVLTVLAGLILHMFGVYSLILRFVGGISPRWFFQKIKVVLYTAFSTSSSTATLPTTIKCSEEELKIPKPIGNFVLTVGASANQNGTALYEGVTVLFIAQLAGVPLSLHEQIGIACLAILASLGTAGVPSGSIPFIALVLTNYNINPGYIAIILGVDRILDMCRTTVNVAGDLAVAACVAAHEYPSTRGLIKGDPEPK